MRNQTAWSHFQQYQIAITGSSANRTKTYTTAPKSECWDSGPQSLGTVRDMVLHLDMSQQELPKL